MKGNCMTGCKHCLVKDITERELVKCGSVVISTVKNLGHEHYCDKDPKTYAEWHERNKKNTYEVYKNDRNDCYEPTEVADSLGKMIEISKKILKEEKEND